MATIFAILGGGQQIQRNVGAGKDTEYIKVENSDWVEKYKRNGQDRFTDITWTDDFETLQLWADNWAGCKVTLVEASGNDNSFICPNK